MKLIKLIHNYRNAGVHSLLDAYYERSLSRYHWSKSVATNNLIRSINKISLDHLAVDKQLVERDSRLFVVECKWKGRDVRYLTVYINDSGIMQVDANPSISNKDYNIFAEVLLLAIMNLS